MHHNKLLKTKTVFLPGSFLAHGHDGLRVEVLKLDRDGLKIRIGNPEYNDPIWVDSDAAGTLRDFFADVHTTLEE